MFLTRFAVHRPVTTVMASLIVVLLGWTSLTNLRVDLMPDMTWPVVSVTTLYPGAGPEEIETLVTRPMEQAIGSVAGVEKLSSSSVEGSSNVRVQFAWGTNLDPAIGDIRARLERMREHTPPGVTVPYIRRYNSADSPIVYLGLETDLSAVKATLLVENVIAPRMERIDGVASVRIRGGTRREIHVELDRSKLEAMNMSVNEVLEALRDDNINQPAGDFEAGNLKLLVRSRGEFVSLKQISDTIVRQSNGANVRIRDVGKVIDGEELRTEKTRINGKPGLLVYLFKQAGANTVEVCDAMHEAIDEINLKLDNAKLSVRMDKSDFIREAISNVRRAAVLGTGLAIVVLILFLHSFRSTLVIAVTMPLSVLATFILIYFNGFTLNMVSFGGLALGVGLLVDNSIVVLESIFRKREEGLEPAKAAIDGTQEVASAIVASTLTTLVVFVPLLFADGQTGIMMRELAFVVSFSLICSLVASLSLTPMLATYCIKPEAERGKVAQAIVGPFHRINQLIFGSFEKLYDRLLLLSFKVPLLMVSLMFLGLAVTIGLIPRIGTEFLPKTDDGRLVVNTEMAPGIQLDKLDKQAAKFERLIMDAVPESHTTASFIGDGADDADEWNEAWFSIHLPPRDQRDRSVEEIRKDLAKAVGQLPGSEVKVQVRNDQFGSKLFRSDGENIAIEIAGHDQQVAEDLSKHVVAAMERVPGLINVRASASDRRPELSIRMDREKANTLGISVSDITQTVETAIQGTRTTVYREDGNEFNVIVRLRQKDRTKLKDIEQVGITTPGGRVIPLKNLVEFNKSESSIAIKRLSRQRVRYVMANIEDRDLGSVVADIQKELKQLPNADGFAYRIAGDWEDQQKSFRTLTYGFILAVLLMYMVMASQFESLGNPLLILTTLPLAAIGVISILLLTETTLNVQSFIGLVMLAGIVVNNAIVLIDYMNQLRDRGESGTVWQIAHKAAVRRFRPILMTTLTTVLAMLPIALGVGDGGELQAPMARVVIGGLASATLITLLAIPIGWSIFQSPKPAASATQKGTTKPPATAAPPETLTPQHIGS
jgi:hydrophobic/amphiphilic exporter-1 (mainly G- bacteria), HAE1 family